MRWLKVIVPAVALGVVAASTASANVPSFTRQTGLTCNQCHMTWTPTPDMTFTGIKFRVNGYRTPWVAEKIEAGEEGALNGRRLALSLTGYLTYHMRSNLFQQSKPASSPAVAEPDASPVASNPFSSLAWDFTGPITENMGIWTEWYSAGGGTRQTGDPGNQIGFVRNDEFDVRMAWNPGDGGNIVSVFMNNQTHNANFFGAFNSGATSNQGQFIHMGVAAWLKDRVTLQLAIMPGSDNLDYERMNYGIVLGVLPLNTDALYLVPTLSILTGDDQIPMVSTSQLVGGYPGTLQTRDGIPGISAYRTGNQPYAATDQGDATRILFDVRFGALDRGPWSFTSATGFSSQNETYSDGAKTKLTAFGFTGRFFYNRTYGVNIGVNKRLTYEFTDAAGGVHKIPSDLAYNVLLVYRQAMNFAWEFGFSNSQSLRLAENYRNGWSWNLQWHFLY
jgi:hypothetical protein